MKKIKVFLDDIRTPPAGWILVHWHNEAIKLLQEFDVEEISLDHDLGDDQRGTGYDVILWIEEKVALDGFVPPKIVVHSANVSARLKMEQGIKNIIKLSKHYE